MDLKDAITKKWREFASDPFEAIKRLGLKTSYGLLVASTVLPIAQAYAQNQSDTLLALGAVVGGIGVNLLSNFVQKVLDKSLSPSDVEELAKSDPALQEVLDILISQTSALQSAQEALTTQWDSFARNLERDLNELRDSPRTLAILHGHSIANTTMAAPMNVVIGPGGTLNINGALLSQTYTQMPISQAQKSRARRAKTSEVSERRQVWERGECIYYLNLNEPSERIQDELRRWRFVSTSERRPTGAVADGVIGIGQNDGTTFCLSPVRQLENCSVEFEICIVDDGSNQDNWAGVRLRAYDFCHDFRLGYLVYLRRSGTVELYGPKGVLAGASQVKVNDTKHSWTRLRVDVFQSEILVMVNGEVHFQKKDLTFRNEGFVFLHTLKSHAQFRDFRVYELRRARAKSNDA